MNCKFTNVLMFAVGAAIGSAVTWKLLKTKYERIVQEEIESIKEAFADMPTDIRQQDDDCSDEDEDVEQEGTPGQINWDELEDLDEEEEEEDDSPENRFMTEYTKLANSYSNEKGGAENVGTKPYVIDPYDFGERDGYRKFELTYYADGTLEDEDYNIVDDVDDLIGVDSLNTFGRYEDDSVFVRNDKLRSDFQILKDPRTYEEARSIGPGKVDDE